MMMKYFVYKKVRPKIGHTVYNNKCTVLAYPPGLTQKIIIVNMFKVI